MTVIDFKSRAKEIANKSKIDRFTAMIEAITNDPYNVTGYLPVPLLKSGAVGTEHFHSMLLVSCLSLLENLRREISSYKDINDKRVQDYYMEIVDGFHDWYDSENKDSGTYAITLLTGDATLGNSVMQYHFAVKANGQVVLGNIFCELGDISSRILQSISTVGINLTYGN